MPPAILPTTPTTTIHDLLPAYASARIAAMDHRPRGRVRYLGQLRRLDAFLEALPVAAVSAALGYAQWRVLGGVLPALRWQTWTGATALAGVAAWALGMLPNTLVDALGLGMTALAMAWAVVAPGVLLSIGVAQWLVLRRHVRPAALWVPANALGWGLGVSTTFLGVSLVSEAMPLWAAVLLGVASGVAMGLIVGCVTGLALVRLLSQS